MRHALLFAAMLLIGCGTARAGEEKPAPITLNLGVSRTPAALPLLHMLESGVLADAAAIKLTVWTGPEQLAAMVLGGRHQLFTLPLTIAAKLYNRGIGIRITNVNTWGAMQLLTRDGNLRDWKGLQGKTVYVPQRFSPPDALTAFFLEQAGLDRPDAVQIIHAANSEIAQLLLAGKIDCAVLLEPQAAAALRDPEVRVAFDYETEWRKYQGEDAALPSLGIGGLAEFLDAQPELAARFEKEYRNAVTWVLDHPAETGRLAERYLGWNAELVEKALPRMGLRYSTAAEAEADVTRLYRLLHAFSSAVIGDAIPDATLFWRNAGARAPFEENKPFR